jgi:hypothetical protein
LWGPVWGGISNRFEVAVVANPFVTGTEGPHSVVRGGIGCVNERPEWGISRPSLYHPGATGFDLDEVNGGFIEPVAPVTAIGADIETGRVTP